MIDEPVENTVAGVVHGPVVQAGSIAGGVHVHYGSRRHVIEAVPEPAQPPPRWLMEQPSRLLDARGQVVPFTGREAELERLREWRDQEARFAVRLLHGPGGQGKTRLAAEFAERSRHGWNVVQARLPGSPSEPSLDGSAGLLLIVDYADRWAHTELTRLFADPVLRGHNPIRVLLIGRAVRWYAAIRAELAERRAAVDDMPLPPLTDDRHAVFAAARDRYAQPDLYDLPEAGDIRPPDHRDFGLVLTLHMAALVAVDARKRGQRAPTEPHELSGYLLDREYQAWQRLHDAGAHGQDYRTRPAVMAKAVFTAALTGAVTHDTGTSALEAVNLPGEDLLLDHRFCYPPADRGLVLEPLYPDRLAEDFLGLLMPGHTVSAYDPDPWATSVPAKLLTTDDVRQATAARAVTFLASAAARWPHLAEESLYPLVRRDPALAVEAGSSALTTLADLDDIPFDVLEAVYSALPRGSRPDLDVGAAAITGAYVTRMLDVVDDDEARAELHLEYSNRLDAAGHRRQSLEHSWRAVEHFRALAENDAAHLHSLARAVHNHAGGLASVGLREDALECSKLAVDLREHLVEHDPAHLEDLARSTGSHAMRLAENGLRAQAVEYSGRAVEQYRALTRTDPAHLAGLARSYDSHASRLAEVGRPADALEYSALAVEHYRELVATGSDDHDRALARAYDHHSWWLAEAGKTEEALHSSHQAVAAFERLAGVNRVAFLPDLAAAVANLANRLAEAGQRDEALTCSWRAVELAEELAEDDRVAHLPRLAVSVSNLAVRVPDEAGLEQSRRAVALREELVRDHRAAHLPDLAASVGNLASALVRAGQLAEALEHSRRAVELWEELADDHRAAHLSKLMAATHNHGAWLALAERPEAARYSQRAVRLRAELADGHPPDAAEQLAWSGQHAEALLASHRAVEQYRALSASDPDTYLRDLAAALDAYARIRLQLRTDLDSAHSAADESYRTYRHLKSTDHALDAAHTLAAVLRALGRPDQAEQVHRDAGGTDASYP